MQLAISELASENSLLTGTKKENFDNSTLSAEEAKLLSSQLKSFHVVGSFTRPFLFCKQTGADFVLGGTQVAADETKTRAQVDLNLTPHLLTSHD